MRTSRCLVPWNKCQRASRSLLQATGGAARRPCHGAPSKDPPDPERRKAAWDSVSETLRTPRHITPRLSAGAGRPGPREDVARPRRGGRSVRVFRGAVGNERLPLSPGNLGLRLTGTESSGEKCVSGGRRRRSGERASCRVCKISCSRERNRWVLKGEGRPTTWLQLVFAVGWHCHRVWVKGNWNVLEESCGDRAPLPRQWDNAGRDKRDEAGSPGTPGASRSCTRQGRPSPGASRGPGTPDVTLLTSSTEGE